MKSSLGRLWHHTFPAITLFDLSEEQLVIGVEACHLHHACTAATREPAASDTD